MKTITSFLVAFFLLAHGPVLRAQSTAEIDGLLYRAYLTTSQTLWNEAIDRIDRHDFDSKVEKLRYRTEAQSGLVIYALANEDETTFDQVIDPLKDDLKWLVKQDPRDARSHALLSSAYSAEIAFSPTKGMYLGSRSSKHIEQALSHQATSPMAWFQRASSKLFTPAMFGGSVEEAVDGFERAVAYYEAEAASETNWRYLNALAWLGLAYEKTGETASAIKVYEKALTVEPDFGWVKYALLPQAQGKAQAVR